MSNPTAPTSQALSSGPLRCLVLDDYQQVAQQLAAWERLDGIATVEFVAEHLDPDALVDRARGYQVLVVMRERTPLPADVLVALPDLRLIVTSGMRNASIDLAAAAQQGIAVCGTSSASEPPAELTWALILGLLRHISTEAGNLRAGGPWQRTLGGDLSGRRLGLVGLGKIGTRVARVAQAFDMQVSAWSPHLTAERAHQGGAEWESSLEALMERSDVVSLHLVLGPTTRGLIGPDQLARMKPEAVLINTARAGLVDQDALIAALQAGTIAGAGLDVFDLEPLPREHPYRDLPNVLATPHLGYVTQRNYRAYFTGAVEGIEGFAQGQVVRPLT